VAGTIRKQTLKRAAVQGWEACLFETRDRQSDSGQCQLGSR